MAGTLTGATVAVDGTAIVKDGSVVT